MLGLFMFRDSFANIVMITFTALILIEILNVYTQVSTTTFKINHFCFLDPRFHCQNDVYANCFSCRLYGFVVAFERVL